MVTIRLVGFVWLIILICAGLSKLFSEDTGKIVEVRDTDIYVFETVEYEDCYEIKTFDKNYKKYLESSYVGKYFGVEK